MGKPVQKPSALRGKKSALGFTLIELLVGIALIAILASLPLPALGKRYSRCKVN